VSPLCARLTPALLAALCAAASPAPADAQIARNDYAARRSALVARVDSGVVIAFGGVESVNYWPFFQLPSFYYLTGLDETDAALVLVKRNDSLRTTMFVPSRNPMQERWIGARIKAADMKAKIGIDGRDIVELTPAIDSLAGTGLPFYVISDVQAAENTTKDSLTRGSRFVSRLRTSNPWLVMRSLDTAVTRLRAKKTAGEIALLRKAAQISVKGHLEAMKATTPGCGENEIQALLEGTFRRLGGNRTGYGSIVGSGPNATVLHYEKNNRVMQDGELLLIDAAGAFDNYSADITRTMPVSGKFTPAQRDIYQIVLDAQGAFVRQIKPGSSLLASSDSGKAVVAQGLLRLGLIESAGATFEPPKGMPCPPSGCSQLSLYALHGYGGHGIGLEVHDPAQYYQPAHNFEPGDVFTVEPGLYFSPDLLASLPDTPANRKMLVKIRPAFEKYKGIGVRIEDDYALTQSGLEWLSTGAPREIADVEALMRQREPDLPGGGGCQRMRT
jgi:Xaa-Pro aminopeptidase